MEVRPTAAWMQVLGQIEEALAKTLDQWPEPPAPAPDERGNVDLLRAVDERSARLQTCLDQAGREAAEVEGLLTVEIQMVEGWLKSAAEVRQRLENRVAGGV
jgi:hypothetical protein